jgi:lysophospholipase L1-like esterase
MRSKNNIYVFFVALALIFWNPLSFYFIYGNTPVYSFKLIHFFFWLVFAAGIVIILSFLKNRVNGKLSNLIFSLSIAGILFSLIVIANGLVGLSQPVKRLKKARKEGLIFEPGIKAHYHTVEFNSVAEINSLGLRDREISKDKGDKYRIVCIGDSWTYGWGVDIENTWPGKLEVFLQSKGIKNVEVINCGQRGRYPALYLENIKKIVPALKPDLVLLGMLQLDDLAQAYEENFPALRQKKQKISVWQKINYAARIFLETSADNILMLAKKRNVEEDDIRKNWQHTVLSRIKNFSYEQTIRYNLLNDSLRFLLEHGEINPTCMYRPIDLPDRNIIFNNPDLPVTQFAISETDKQIQLMKAVCMANNSVLVFINLPCHFFTGHKVMIGPDDVLNPFLENNNKIDSIYRAIALKNGLPYFEMTKEFRALEDKSAYFFRYDGHPNEKGYDEIARLVAGYLADSSGIIKK